jgi:hypothetical protein
VASKYGTDLAQLTCVLAEDVRFTLDSLKQDLDDNLPKQIKSVVKELVGNVQGKQTVDLAGASAQQASPHVGVGATAGEHRTMQPMNPNYPQPYYQTMTYGPNFLNSVGNAQCGMWPETRPPVMSNTHTMLNTDRAMSSEMSNHVREQVSRTLRELGFAAHGCAKSYRKPYPEFFDSVPYPRGFRVPDFVKFTREDSRTTYEHVGQYLA